VYRDADGRVWIGDGSGKQRAQGDNPAFVEQRQADQHAFLSTVPDADAAADAKVWAAFENGAKATADREGQEAQAAADFAKRTGVAGALRGANDFGVSFAQSPFHLAESVYNNGLIPTAEQMVENLLALPGQFTTAVSSGDMRTASAAGLGLYFMKLPEGEAGTATATATGLRFGGDTTVEGLVTEAGGKVPVQLYDVMTYGQSKAGAVKGDALTGDHIPSIAAIRDNVETTLDKPLTRAEESALRDNTHTVIIGQDLHEAGRTYFGANTPAQIAGDAGDLAAAALRDQAVHLENARSMGYSPVTLQASFDRLNEMNLQLFGQLSTRQSTLDWFKSLGL
jgi:hypothetical protein